MSILRYNNCFAMKRILAKCQEAAPDHPARATDAAIKKSGIVTSPLCYFCQAYPPIAPALVPWCNGKGKVTFRRVRERRGASL
jgi:hypothetical protein